MTFARIRNRLLVLGGLVMGLASALMAAPNTKLVVTNARLFTMVDGQEKPFLGYFTVGADGRFGVVKAGAPAPDEIVGAGGVWDAQGQWILPGFISAHSHLWQSAYRGLAFDQTLMGWATAVYTQNAVFAQPDSFYWFTLQGALDHLRHGITGAYNFTFSLAPDRAQEFSEQQFRAERDSGIRFVHGFNIGMIGPNFSPAQARAQTERLLQWIQTQGPVPGFLSAMINGAGAWAPTAEQTLVEGAIMREFKVGNQAHFLESPPDQYEERTRFRWFLDAGSLGPGLLFGHFVHTDPWIIRETVRAGAAMSWNPLSNGRLASGIVDIPAYRKAGMRIGMGVDGQASADRADPFENLRMGLYQVRAKYEDATVLSPYDVLRMHTLGSADVLGVADRLGSLTAGKLADFIVVDPAGLGPVFDPYASLVFVAGETDLKRVYVGGEIKVKDGALLGNAYAEACAEVKRRVKVPPLP